MAIIVVGQRQPRSKRVLCGGCGKELEYLENDLTVRNGLVYLRCPRKPCQYEMYLGTDPSENTTEPPTTEN